MVLEEGLAEMINNMGAVKRNKFEPSKLDSDCWAGKVIALLEYCFKDFEGAELFCDMAYSPLGVFYPSGSPDYIIEEREEGADVVGRFMELDGSSLVLHKKFEYQSSKYSEMYFGKFGKKPLIQLADSFSYV